MRVLFAHDHGRGRNDSGEATQAHAGAVIPKLREADRLLDEGKTVPEVARARLARERGAPAHVRCDNGSELTAHALQDWCRFSQAETAFIDPGAMAEPVH